MDIVDIAVAIGDNAKYWLLSAGWQARHRGIVWSGLRAYSSGTDCKANEPGSGDVHVVEHGEQRFSLPCGVAMEERADDGSFTQHNLYFLVPACFDW